jgi:hypothetical protein
MKHISLFMAVLLLSMAAIAGGSVPSTQIKAGYCGRMDYIRNSELWADAVTGATQYEFQISDAADAVIIATRLQSSGKLILSQVTPALQWNTQYNVRVRAFIGVDAGTFGTPCMIGLIANPATTMPTTTLTGTSCNATGLSLSDFIYAQQVPGATHYKFEFTNTGSGVVTTREVTSYFIKLNNTIPLLATPGNYDVRVAVRFSTLYTGAFSGTCPISIGPGPANIPSSRLAPAYCGATGLGLNSAIQANGVSAATQYEFEFRTVSTNSLVAIKLNNTRTIALNSVIPSLQWNTQYNVRVKAYRGTASGPYGTPCTISLIADPSSVVPSTSLNSASCGVNNLTPFSTVNAAAIAGATQYLFSFSQGGVPYASATSATPTCNLANVSPAINWNSTYSVIVQATVGGVQGSPGLACTIATVPDPAIVGVPDTRLTDAFCNNLSLNITSTIGAIGVLGATIYDFHFYDPSNPTVTYAEVNQNSNSLPVINVSPALQPNVTYTVYVRAKIGNVFGNFSTACTINISNASPARFDTESNNSDPAQAEAKGKFKVFPNPTEGMIQIIPDFTTDQTLTISIIDMAGKLVFQERKTASGTFSIEPQLTGGLYFMEISDGNGLKFHEKLIRK